MEDQDAPVNGDCSIPLCSRASIILIRSNAEPPFRLCHEHLRSWHAKNATPPEQSAIAHVRDEFAAKAMAALLQVREEEGRAEFWSIAKEAYAMAELMMKERLMDYVVAPK